MIRQIRTTISLLQFDLSPSPPIFESFSRFSLSSSFLFSWKGLGSLPKKRRKEFFLSISLQSLEIVSRLFRFDSIWIPIFRLGFRLGWRKLCTEREKVIHYYLFIEVSQMFGVRRGFVINCDIFVEDVKVCLFEL